MKLLLVGAMLCTSLALAVGPATAHNPPGQQLKPCPPNQVKKVQELAAKLCIAAVGSGAYSDLNDDDLSDLCKNTAEHILKGPYDHVIELDAD